MNQTDFLILAGAAAAAFFLLRSGGAAAAGAQAISIPAWSSVKPAAGWSWFSDPSAAGGAVFYNPEREVLSA